MAESETLTNTIKIETELEGDQDCTSNYRFSKIGEGVSVTSDADFKFDFDSLPSRPLAVSERFGVVFVAHLSGFCVVRTKDVISTAEELAKGGEGFCIQDLSVVDVSLGKVSILALSADSSTLAACVGFNLYFFSVARLLDKDHKPYFSKSFNGSSCIKDMQWSPHLENNYVVLTSDGKLYRGAGKDDLSSLLDNADAVNWSMNGKFLAVAQYDYLNILSSKFKEKLRIKLLFDSLADDDADCVVKVDSIKWVRPDCIMLGCYRVSADGKEENHLVQLISVKDGKITNTSSNPVALTFSSAFLAINEDDVPSGSGPYMLVSYLDEFEVAFVGNMKNTDQHIVLFVWSSDKENKAEILDLASDAWLPIIGLPANGDDYNMVLGIAIDKVHQNEKVKLVCGENETEVSPCCILMCLTVDGKLFMFHFASAIGPSVLPEDVTSVSDEEEEEFTLHELQSQKVIVNEPIRNAQTKSTASSQLYISGTQQDVPVVKPNNSKHQMQPLSSQKQDGKSESVKSVAMFKDSKASTESSDNKASFGLHGSSGSFSSGSFFSSNAFGAQSSSSFHNVVQGSPGLSRNFGSTSLPVSSGSFSSGGVFSSKTFDVKSSQPPHAAAQVNRSDTGVGTTLYPSGSQKTSFSKMTSGPSTSSTPPQGVFTGTPVAKSLPVASNAQPRPENFRHHTPSRLLNSELKLSEQHSVEEMAKELDALLDSIERPGGFYESSVAAHKPSVAALEDGIWLLSDKCQKWTDTMHRGIEEVQLLLDKTVQVLARKIYMEALVKQATDSQYLDIWNRQKLSSELDMKRRNILEINQNLTNQLIELERHLNTLELQRFGDTSDAQMNRKSFHAKHNPPRHVQSLHSLHNTMNAQLTAAEKLSECLSKQMAVLSIETEPVKKQNVKKDLFDTIGISYDGSTFSSPGQQKAKEILPKSQLLNSSSSAAVNSDLKKSQLDALKSLEPETARRRRDSLDRSWASIEPPKTTVKRMLLHEDRQMSPARLSIPITTQKSTHRLSERSMASNDISHDALNMSRNRGSQDAQIKRHFEEQSSSLWGNYRSESTKPPVNSGLSFGSGSQSTPIVTRDAANDSPGLSAEKSSSRLTFSLKSDPVRGNNPKFSQQSQSVLESSSNTARPLPISIFQQKPIEFSQSGNKTIESSSLWSRKTTEAPFSAVSSASSSTAFSGKSFSLEASTRESQVGEAVSSSIASLPVPVTLAPSSSVFKDGTSSSTSLDKSSTESLAVPVTLAPSSFSFKDTTSSSTYSISSGKSSTGVGFNLGATQTVPSSGPSPSFLSFPSTTSFKPSVNTELNTAKSDPPKLNSDTIESSKPTGVSVLKFNLNTNETSSGQASSLQPVVSSAPSGPTGQPSTSLFSERQPSFNATSSPALISNSKPEQPLVSPVVSSPPISNPVDGVGVEINGSDLAVTQEDEMDEEAPDTAQLTLGNLGGFGLGSSPNPSAPKQNPFGAPFGNPPANTQTTSFTASPLSGGLFKPASFSIESQQPTQPPQQTSFNAFSGGGFGNNNQTGGGQGFGQPAKIGSGQQALGSVLGSFGQSRQFGAGISGSVASPSPYGSGFGANQSGGFATASSGSSGFANLASGGGGFGGLATSGGGGFAAAATGGGGFSAAASGGGGFGVAASGGGGFGAASTGGGGFGAAATGGGGFGPAATVGGGFGAAATGGGGFGAAATGGGGFGAAATVSSGFGTPLAVGGFGAAPAAGGGFAGAASGGFGGFSSQGGGGFSTFGSSGGTAKPPSELFTQMRK